MKLLVLLVAVGVASANICDNPDGLKEDIPELTQTINDFLEDSVVLRYFTGTFNDIIANPSCRSLYEEGFCYFNVGAKRYDALSLDNVAADLSFELIAEGVPDAASYGQNLCDNARICIEYAKKVVKEKVEILQEDIDFLIDLATGADEAITKSKQRLEELAAENPGTVIGRLSNLALEKLGDKTFAELKQESMEYGDQYELQSSYTETKSKFLALGKEFCNKGCIAETAKALTNEAGEGLLDYLGREPTCKPAAFCDNCVGPAETYFENNGVPCCLKTVIDAGLEKIDYLKEKYGDEVNEFVEDEGTDDEQDTYKSVRKQLKCYRESYESYNGACTEEEAV